MAHYVSKFGSPPVKLEPPYPGMEKREKDVEVQLSIEEQLKHGLRWARPKGAGPEMEPPHAIYFEPRQPKGWGQKWRRRAKIRAHGLKVDAMGNMFALRIQRNVRMWQVRSLAARKKQCLSAVKRHNAAVRIQAIARRYVMKESVAENRQKTVAAVNLVGRLIRGLLARKKVARMRAIRVLQRARMRAVGNALMYAVRSTLVVRREHEHEGWAKLTLHRYAKGFVTRLRVKQAKEQKGKAEVNNT